MTTTRTVHLTIQPWLRDHCFNGRVILPAVEAMRLSAQLVQRLYPEVDILTMENARFLKFLEIPPNIDEMDILIEVGEVADKTVMARLLTRKQLKIMTRLTSHCELHFGRTSEIEIPPFRQDTSCKTSGPLISAERIYHELVPFGPTFQTLCGQVQPDADSAHGKLLAPKLPLEFTPFGSVFPIDGAMHAACVHGQRLVDFVPFPVGFAARIISIPTVPGGEYGVDIQLCTLSMEELVYDLQIYDNRNRIRETMKGLRMRDVSNGRIKPPDWIKSKAVPRQTGQKVESTT